MLWVKAFHIIFMVTWFAGLFYLPRLFVYHADTSDAVSLNRFALMEKRLSVMMSIGAAGTLVFGLWLLLKYQPTTLQYGWMQVKLLLVLALIGYHGYCQICMKKLREGRNKHSSKFYRLFNEVPALALVGIVILVIVRPF